jgi:quercetin dioxygenase-like cupin family protein
MFHRCAPLFVLALLAVPASALAHQPVSSKESGGMSAVAGAALKWTPADIPGFVPGMEMAVVAGDPSKAEPYTLRLRFPKDYVFPAHWHPQTENLTVLEGKFVLGMGSKTDKTMLKEYERGDYLVLPGNQPHFGGAKGDNTVIQLHGVGPFGITVTEEIAGAAKKKE